MEGSSQTTGSCNCSEMEQEIEKLKKALRELKEDHESLLKKDEKKLDTIAELSVELEALRKAKGEEKKNYEMYANFLRKQKDDMLVYYTPIWKMIVHENEEYQKMLRELNFLPSFELSSLSISDLDSSTDETSQSGAVPRDLQEFARSGEPFGVPPTVQHLQIKVNVLVNQINRERAQIKLMLEKAEAKKKDLLTALEVQQKKMESQKNVYTNVKDTFTEVSRQLSVEMEKLKIKVKQLIVENHQLNDSLQNMMIDRIRSGDLLVPGDPNVSGCSASSDDADNDGNGATANVTTLPSSDTADTALSETLATGTASPMFECVVKDGKTLNTLKEKRKNQSDVEEASKKIKSLSEFTREDFLQLVHELEQKMEQLHKANLSLKLKLDLAAAQKYQLRKEVYAENITIKGAVAQHEIGLRPYAYDRQIADQLSRYERECPSKPVSPITRDQARAFCSKAVHLHGTFSQNYVVKSYSLSDFLVYKPIAIENPTTKHCYMISVVQALANVPRFSLQLVCGIESQEGSLLHALFETYKHFWVEKVDIQNGHRPKVLEATKIKEYYAENHSDKFDPSSQHDAEEFLLDLINNLENEVLRRGGEEEDNLVTRLFRGYIVSPNGTKDYFRTLRLSIKDDGIHTVQEALCRHLVKPTDPTPALPIAPADPPRSSSPSAIANIDDKEMVATEKCSEHEENLHSRHPSQTEETDNLEVPQVMNEDSPPLSQERSETVPSSEINEDGEANRDVDSLQDRTSDDNVNQSGIRKIFAPEILCVCLDRHDSDYSFNPKEIRLGNIGIPADLLAPEGATRPVRYRLMSVVRYIPGDVTQSTGHYFTCTMSPVGHACVLNDGHFESAKISQFDVNKLQGYASIVIYAKVPDAVKL